MNHGFMIAHLTVRSNTFGRKLRYFGGMAIDGIMKEAEKGQREAAPRCFYSFLLLARSYRFPEMPRTGCSEFTARSKTAPILA